MLAQIQRWIMNNLEQNALRIADLINPNRALRTFWRDADIYKFSSYQGLIPIVFECNKSEHYGITINWSVRLTNKTDGKTLYYKFKVTLRTESEFIEAIQLAVIKYLELKNEN